MATGRQEARQSWRVGERCCLALRWGGLVIGAGTSLLAIPCAYALTINPTFEPSITGSGSAATIESAINNALGFYSAFDDPVTVSIDFQLVSGTVYVGRNVPTWGYVSYSNYATALYADAVANGNSDELSGYNNLNVGNMASQIRATSADLRALGFNVSGTLAANGGSTGSFDGIVYLNATAISGFGQSGGYSAEPTIQHEIDEVLGIGGDGSVLNSGTSQAYIGPMDLYRYSAPGSKSFTTSSSASSYFSVDGGLTDIVAFDQNSGGDYGDWGSTSTPEVQQAFGTPGSQAYLTAGAPEVVALQAVGYDIPEPAEAAVFAMSLVGLAIGRRRRRPG